MCSQRSWVNADLFLYFLRQAPSLHMDFMRWLGWLASKAPASFCVLPERWDCGTPALALVIWMLGFGTHCKHFSD